MTHQKIIAMLAGASSQKPMLFDDLVKASGLLPATLEMLLEQMAHSIPMSINRATITKNGKMQMMIWPTGVINKAAPPFVISNEKAIAAGYATQPRPALWTLRPQASQVQPSTSTPLKEIPMSAHPGKLNTIIYNRIAEQPGITQDALLQFALHNVAGVTEKQVRKTILNLVHASKKICSAGPRGKFTYHVNTEVKQSPATLAKETVVKHSEPVASEPAPRPSPQEEERKESTGKPGFMQRIARWLRQSAAPVTFTLLLTDDNCLHLVIDDDLIMLTEEQTRRLKTFMDRITLTGSHA